MSCGVELKRSLVFPGYFAGSTLRRQNPDDWWNGLGDAVRAAVQQAGVSTADIVSIGVDTTCCSVVALNASVSEVSLTLALVPAGLIAQPVVGPTMPSFAVMSPP